MRWVATPRNDWRTRFAILPVKIGYRWIWLERYERRFMGDCYEVRAALSAPALDGEHPTAADWRNRAERAEAECKDLLAKLERVLAIFPSGAGMPDQPDSKVIAFYINLGELRALKAVVGEIV